MTREQEIGNEIIAQYMGIEIEEWKGISQPNNSQYRAKYWHSDYNYKWAVAYKPSEKELLSTIANISKYHSDWNWMADVLQKLLPELKEQQRIAGNMADDVTLGHLEGLIGSIEMALLELSIDKVFSATVNAITELNKMKEDGKDA